jgi:hypothetical protein
MIERKRKLALRALIAAVAVLIALPLAILGTLPTSALAATNHSSGVSVAGHATPPTPTTTETKCAPAASSGTQRCIRVQRLPVSSLSAAQRSDRNTMLSKQIAKDKASRAQAATAASVSVTPPTSCQFVTGVGATGWVANPDRFTSCSDFLWSVTTYPVVDGVPDLNNPVGNFQWEDAQWTSYSATSSSWTHGLIAYGYPVGDGTWGVGESGFSGGLSSNCEQSFQECSAVSLGAPDPQQVTMLPGQTQEFGWTETDAGASSTTPNTDTYLDGFLGVDWDLYTVPPLSVADTTELSGRCDTIVTTTDGCVDEYNVPTLMYDSTTNPLVAPVAQNIYNQQNGPQSKAWGVPSYVSSKGQWLNRDMNSADITANRKAACGSASPPTGFTCDEFPLASTYQGAAFQSVYVTANVPTAANSSQGGLTSAFYTSNRVNDDDPFYVNVRLPDSSYSW